MTRKEIKALHNQARELFEDALSDETIVLCVDGKPTDNNYPIYLWGEPDGKTPKEWVNDIIHFSNYKGKLSFAITNTI